MTSQDEREAPPRLGSPGFLPNLGTLRGQIESAVPKDEFRTAYFYLELLPYSLGATYQALVDLVEAEQELIRGRQLTHEDGKRILNAVGAGGRDKLSYRIDSFLESARRTQNALIPYISRVLSISLPQSLDDVVKKLERKTITLPVKITNDILGYWNHQGKMLKDYRDLSQHHALVSSDVRIFLSSDNRPAIYMTLPNNPEVKNPAKLVFDKPPIHAFVYVRTQFDWLLRLCNEITTALTKPPEGNVRSVTGKIMFRSPVKIGPEATWVGHHVTTVEKMRAEIEQLVATLKRL